VSRSGGASGQNPSPADEAAGAGPISGVNTVYEDHALSGRVIPAGNQLLTPDQLPAQDQLPSADQVPPIRRPARKPSRSWRAAFFAIAVTGLVAVTAWAFLGPQLLVVRSIVVTGTHLVPRSEVLAAAGVRPGTPLIRVNPGQVAARIETISQVQSARVSRHWPDRVLIVISERTAALAVMAPGGGFDLVDADGVTVRWALRRPAGFPLYPAPPAGTPVTSLRGNPDLAAAAAVLGVLPAWLRHTVESMTAPSPDQVTLQLPHGVTVLWGGAADAARKAQELMVLMPTHSRYYDVSGQGTASTG
jgi:cell division protein FtsQ